MTFLDFEEPIAQLYDKRKKLVEMQAQGDLNLDDKIAELDKVIEEKKENLIKMQVGLTDYLTKLQDNVYIKKILGGILSLGNVLNAGSKTTQHTVEEAAMVLHLRPPI